MLLNINCKLNPNTDVMLDDMNYGEQYFSTISSPLSVISENNSLIFLHFYLSFVGEDRTFNFKSMSPTFSDLISK